MNLKELLVAGGMMLPLGCSANVKVDPVEVKPIKMTIDVNIKVDRQLDEFFEFEEEPASETAPEEKGT
jgi:hypothetical protein